MFSQDGFILTQSQADGPGKSTRLVFQGRLASGRRFRWSVTRPRLCFFVEREAEREAGPAPRPAEAAESVSLRFARKPLELKTLRGRPVDALYFTSSQDLARARRLYEGRGVPTYEADVPAAARHLMERGIRGGVRFLDPPARAEGGVLHFEDPKVESSAFTPALRLLSLDVECSGQGELYSISAYGRGGEAPLARVFMVDPAATPMASGNPDYTACPDERGVLAAFFQAVRDFDPDALIGWNVVNFDLRFLSRKCARLGLALDLGVDGPAELLEPDAGSRSRFGAQWLARVPGRAVLDGINMLKAAFVDVEGYSLNSVAHELLGKAKLIELEGTEKIAEIERQFRADKASLARYNLVDAELVDEIFAKLSLSQLAVRKAQITGLAVDRMAGSNAALDFLYLPRLHRHGYVADTSSRSAPDDGVPGGLVLEGDPGFHRDVLVLDFKSLYPSIIRTFFVDPLAAAAAEYDLPTPGPRTLARGPAGPAFVRELAILPGIVASLWESREEAKRTRDASLSQAVKIIMNSLYGVLGSPGCRFYLPELAGTITRSGHWILLRSKAFLEKSGYRVIYGDTDSLFLKANVPVGSASEAGGGGAAGQPVADLRRLGGELSEALNRHLQGALREEFGLESRLNVEFEKVFLRFFLPALRKEDRGSKKRYAGLMVAGSKAGKGGGPENGGAGEAVLQFTGMESARSDWTRLAKDFQADLLSLVFRQDRMDDKGPLEILVREWHRRLMDGELDDHLVYRKGLSKDPSEYTGAVPPHVRAALALDKQEGRYVRYVMTVDGPEPVQKRSGARPDYRHYAEKQLAPVADMVLRFLGTDFHALTDDSQQLNIF